MSSQNDPDDSREEPREQAKSQEQVEDVPFDTGRVDTCTADTGSSIYSADISTVEPVNVAPSGVNKGNDAILDTTSSNIVLSGADPSIDGPSNAELAAIEPPSTAPSEANRGNASPSDLEPSSAESPDTSLLGASQDNTIHLNPTPPNTIHSDASIGNSSAESSSNIASFDVEAFIAELVNITISDPDHERTTGSYTVSTEATPSSPAPSNVISPKTGPGKAKFSNIRNLNAESSEAGPSSSRLRADTGFPSTRDPPSNIASPEAPAYIDLTRQSA
ncbi:hypothetical protein M426DRAFT_210162 [Hypoxylon sp. CI-4A]|nr:hypothetical protein M426DRAFT_210162 [Hypoxylon sp. CI-4A]